MIEKYAEYFKSEQQDYCLDLEDVMYVVSILKVTNKEVNEIINWKHWYF